MTDTILTADELQRIRTRLESDDFDYRDVSVLFCHITAISDSYEAMVTRVAQHNNEAQARMSEIELRALKAEARLEWLERHHVWKDSDDELELVEEGDRLDAHVYWCWPEGKTLRDAIDAAMNPEPSAATGAGAIAP